MASNVPTEWKDSACLYRIIDYLQKSVSELEKHNWSRENFSEDITFQSVCSFYAIQIGENVKHLSKDFREMYSDSVWKALAGMRDVYAHSYHSFEENTAWSTLIEDYPKDLQKCLEICKENGWEIPPAPSKINLNSEIEKIRAEVITVQKERERLYNILIDEPENDCEKKFFALAKHAIKVNKNYTEHNEKLAIRDLFKAGFSHAEISDTLEKYSPLVRDKSEIEKNIQDVANKMNSKSSAR